MSFFPGDSRLFGPLFSDPRIAAVFSDEAYLRRLVEVELAITRVQGDLQVIPSRMAECILQRGATFEPDHARLSEAIQRDGFPVIELVRQLGEHVGSEAAPFVHWGATTQDVVDTGLVLQAGEALEIIEADLDELRRRLAGLAERHRDTVMAGRTHSQHAVPITLGLKVSSWLAPFVRHRDRLAELRPRLLVVQFGGAAGTLASLGSDGLAVRSALAAELKLNVPAVAWHAQRDSVAELAGWLAGVSGSLGKIGQDVILMGQSEIAEVSESGDGERGGSSTMPHKRNPVRCELIVAAARQNAALLTSMHQALVQEHERATHGWQLEWLTLPQMVALTSGALRSALLVLGEMHVDVRRMRENVRASRGLMLAEAARLLLARHDPGLDAEAIVKAAVDQARSTGRHLIDVLREATDSTVDWSPIQDEEAYLGSAQQMTDDLLRRMRSK